MGKDGQKRPWRSIHLILVFIFTSFSGSSQLLSLGSSGLSTSKGRVGVHFDVVLRFNSHQERGDIYNLLADLDVLLSDQNSSMMDGVSKSSLENSGLESSFQEFSSGQSQDIIELLFSFVEQTHSDHTVQQSMTFEKSSRILLFEGEQFSGSLSDLSQGELDSPDFSLVLQTIFTDQLKLLVESFSFEGSSGSLRGLAAIISVALGHL
mmetsp:Transcript_24325/g.27609  ORF Transcript_24325/g.27609 Transcript_24325/m.27609 type:complete len:208 (-) Transcript_24325:46-669(-)